MRPIKYSSYKGMGSKWGAAQFSMISPHYKCDACGKRSYTQEPIAECQCAQANLVPREGAVFVEIASTVDKNKYDWEHKTSFALSVDDMGKMLLSFRTGNEVKILHDPGANTDKAGQVTKVLSFVSPKGIIEGGILTLSKKENDIDTVHKVPLTGAEVMVLVSLLQNAIPHCLGW